jgi:hypothetical protein
MVAEVAVMIIFHSPLMTKSKSSGVALMYLKNFQYATPLGISLAKLRNLATKTAFDQQSIY